MKKTTRVRTMLMSLLVLAAAMATAQTPTIAAAAEMNRHTMEGKVTKVDAKRGWIDVKTSEGSMKLHFPPSALTNVKKGDSVSVELGLKDNGPSATK